MPKKTKAPALASISGLCKELQSDNTSYEIASGTRVAGAKLPCAAIPLTDGVRAAKAAI